MLPRRNISPWMVILLAVLLSAQQANACPPAPQTSFYCCLPGFTLVGLHAGFALVVLAALIERPFVTRAGVSTGTLFFTLQANLISVLTVSLAGAMAIWMLSGAHEELLMLGWIVAAPALATLVEYAWLSRKRDADVPRLNWRWLVLGNLISAAIVLIMPVLRALFGTDTYSYIRGIQSSRELIALGTWAACAIVFTLAFTLAPSVSAFHRGRGFEVLMPPSSR